VFQSVDISCTRKVFDTITYDGSVHEVDNTGILSVIETMRKQLCIQQKHLNDLSSQVETVLVYLQGIFYFLGIVESAGQPEVSSQGYEGKPQHGESNHNPAVISAPEVLSEEASSGNRDPGLSDAASVQGGSEHTTMTRTFAVVVKTVLTLCRTLSLKL